MKTMLRRWLGGVVAFVVLMGVCWSAMAEGNTIHVNELRGTVSIDGSEPAPLVMRAVSMEEKTIVWTTTVIVFESYGRSGATERRLTLTLPGNWEAGNRYTHKSPKGGVYGGCQIKFEDLLSYKIFNVEYFQGDGKEWQYAVDLLTANEAYTMCTGTMRVEWKNADSWYNDITMSSTPLAGGTLSLSNCGFYVDKAWLSAQEQGGRESDEPQMPEFQFVTP